MSLSEDTQVELNSIFKVAGFPMKIEEITFWRPAYENSYFENFEPITNVVRLFECDPLHVTLFLTYKGRKYEYELHYYNRDKTFELTSSKLNYCQYGHNEDVTKIEDNMRPIIGLIAASIVPGTLRILYDQEKRGD